MDDFISFMRQAAQTPLLAAGLIGQALARYWLQVTFAVTALGGVALFIRKLRRKPIVAEWSELVLATEPIPEHANCRCMINPLDDAADAAFQEWFEARKKAPTKENQIVFTEQQARRLYQAYQSNRDVIFKQVVSEVTE